MTPLLDYLLPPFAALFLWWAGTGLVIMLDRLPDDTRIWSFGGMTLFASGALLGIGASRDDVQVVSAYVGFVCAILLWGWHELAFLSGWITGPRKCAVTVGAGAWKRLAEALGVLLWHEIGLLLTAGTLWWWLEGSANRTAAWTFTLLYAMRVSAKVNLYLGVRNLALEFLPPQLRYLGSYFRRRRFNVLMPLSLVGGAVMTAALLFGAARTVAGLQAMHLLLASLLVLALLEHLMMVLPLEPSALWRWALRGSTSEAMKRT